MDYTEVLGNFGCRYTLNWNGKDYLFSFMSDRQRQWFESILKRNAYEAIEENEFITEAHRVELRAKFVRDVKAKMYTFGGSYFKEFVQTPEGQVRFVQMLLVENHPDITERDIERMSRDKRRELTAILALIHTESAMELTEVSNPDKKVMLEQVYAKFVLPEQQGGLGLSIEEVSQLTDKQKMAMIQESIRRTDPDAKAKAERKPYNAEESARIDNLLRQHELVK